MGEYWTTPEDISHHWSLLRPELERFANGHEGQVMMLYLIVGNNLVCDVLEPMYMLVEPRNNGRAPDPQTWWSLIRRLRAATSTLNGKRALITTQVHLDGKGNPTIWTRPEAREVIRAAKEMH